MNYSGSEKEIDEAISEIVAESQWKQEKQTPSEFLADFRVAQPIRISHGADLDISPADSLHPFLAFSRRRRTKVYAENLAWNDILRKYKQKGPILEIPKDYPGWFEIMPNKSCKTSIADIAPMRCKQFLVRTAVIGHLSLRKKDKSGEGEDDDGEPQLGPEIRIYPGDILSMGEVVTKKWKSSSVSSPTSKKPKELATKFLECVDREQRHIYLPLGHPGEFYAIWDQDVGNATTTSDYVYYIYDLIQFGFPLMVRLVFGWPPADFPHFSGLLRLIDVRKPDTIVLRNLKHGSCVIMELAPDSDVRIERLQNMELLSNNRSLDRLLAHASDRIYPYLIGMKQMTMKYVVCHDDDHAVANGQSEGPVSPPANQKKRIGQMAKPRDMKHFDILNIFPPLEEAIRQVADSWTLCFKDPTFSSGESRGFSVGDSDTLASEIKGIKINDPEELRRRELDHILLEREAEC